MDTPCYYQLPNEIEKNILSFLSMNDLWSMLQVNQAKSGFAQDAILSFYQRAFEKSGLWEHLPQIVKDGSLNFYFNAFVPKDWLEIIQPRELVNLNSLVQSARISVFSKYLVSDITIQKVPDALTFLSMQLPKEQSIKDYLSAPYIRKENMLEERKKRLVVASAYRQVEATYNLLLLFLLVKRSSEEKVLLFVVDGRLSRWLMSRGVVGLTYQSSNEHLLSALVECSLGSHILPSQRSFDQITYQESAGNILYRLSDDDCDTLVDVDDKGPVLVDAIKRHCFPIIDRFGPGALQRVMGENPSDEEMLLVLLERLGAERLSIALASCIYVENSFEIIVNNCSQFMSKLLAALTIEQLCELVKPLAENKFDYFFNSSSFLAFLSKLNAKSSDVTVTCRANELLLHFSRLEDRSYFASSMILTRSVDYLSASDILIFLNEGQAIWSSFEQSNCLDKFKKTNDFIELCLGCYRDSNLPPSVKQKIKDDYGKREEKANIFNPIPLDLIYWKIFTNSYVETLTYDDVLQAKADCDETVHVRLLARINPLLEQKKIANPPLITQKKERVPQFLAIVPAPALGETEVEKLILQVQESANFVQPIQIIPNQENTSKSMEGISQQKKSAWPIMSSIFKGFCIGLLVMTVTLLLQMFINYEVGALLADTIIDDTWIAFIPGVVTWILSTVYFVVDIRACASSNTANVSTEEDPAPFEIPSQEVSLSLSTKNYGISPLQLNSVASSKPKHDKDCPTTVTLNATKSNEVAKAVQRKASTN